MNSGPNFVDSFHQSRLSAIWDQSRSMPTGTSINHVKGDVFAMEHEVTLNLLIESVGNLGVRGLGRTWLLPFPADFTTLTNLGNDVQHFLGHSDSVEVLLHDVFAGVPPTSMKLPERESGLCLSVGPENSNNPTNIDFPIAGILWIDSSISEGSSGPGVAIWPTKISRNGVWFWRWRYFS